MRSESTDDIMDFTPSDIPTQRALAEVLTGLRTQAGLSQDELEARLHCHTGYVRQIESGSTRIGLLDFHKLCEAMGYDSTKEFPKVCQKLMQSFPSRNPCMQKDH
jgi:transcriptional regulator with XRE-family HTH domain